MKLGIKIVTTGLEAKEGPVFNQDNALEKYVMDIRPFLRRAFPDKEELEKAGADPHTSFDESSKIVYLLQFIGEEGFLFTLIKANTDAQDQNFDNTAVWIHVPINIRIDSAEFVRILNELAEVLLAGDKINESKIQKIANKEYDESPYLVLPLSSNQEDDKVGIFVYGIKTNHQFQEILGPHLYQPGFAAYRALFLVDNRLSLAMYNSAVAYVNVEEIITIPAPEEVDGFKPYIGSIPFDKPLKITNGSHLSITWKQEGFLDITKEVEVSYKVNINNYRPKPEEEFYVFQRKWFTVRADHSDRLLHKARIEINGVPLKEDTLLMNMDGLRYGYDLKVNYDGYDEYYTVLSLKGRKYPMEIRIFQSVHTYEFSLSAYDDKGKRLEEQVLAILKTPKDITKCPIKGYRLSDDEPDVQEGAIYHLSYNKTKTQIIFFILGLLCAGLIWFLSSFFNRPHKQVQLDSSKPTTTKVVEKPAAVVDSDSINVANKVEEAVEAEKPTIEEKAEP